MNDNTDNAGQEFAAESGDYGFLAFQIASRARAQIQEMKQRALLTLELLRSIANMTVQPEGELLVGDGQSVLTLPEPQPAQKFFSVGDIQVSVVGTMTELLGVLAGFSEFCPASNPPKVYLSYIVSGGGVEHSGDGNIDSSTDGYGSAHHVVGPPPIGPNVTWSTSGSPGFTTNIATGVISSTGHLDITGSPSGGSNVDPHIGSGCGLGTSFSWASAYHGTWLGVVTGPTGLTINGGGLSFSVSLSSQDTDNNAVTYTTTRAGSFAYNHNYSVTGDATNGYGFPTGGPGNAGLATNYENRFNDGSWTYENGGTWFWYQYGVYHLHFTGLTVVGRTINWTVIWESQSSNGDGGTGNDTGYGSTWTVAHTDTGSFVTTGSPTHDTPDIACPGATDPGSGPIGTGFGLRYRIKSITFV